MENDIKELIKFLNDIKSNQDDGDKIVKINTIVAYRNSMDIKNGMSYLYEIIKDQDIQKHLKIRQPQANFNILGQPISEKESFYQNCNAVIDAIVKSMFEDKIKDEYKNTISPDFRNFIELIEFYKNIIKN